MIAHNFDYGFPEVIRKGKVTITIYRLDGKEEFVVADQGGWLPGCFPTRDAALAFACKENGISTA